MQLEGAREPRGARRGQTGPKRAQKQKRSLAPGCCALAAAAPGEGALQKRRLACCALAATVRYSRGTTARRRALQPGRRSTAQLQHGAVRCSQGVTARHRALQPGRHSTARRRALQPGHHSTAPCATAREAQHSTAPCAHGRCGCGHRARVGAGVILTHRKGGSRARGALLSKGLDHLWT